MDWIMMMMMMMMAHMRSDLGENLIMVVYWFMCMNRVQTHELDTETCIYIYIFVCM